MAGERDDAGGLGHPEVRAGQDALPARRDLTVNDVSSERPATARPVRPGKLRTYLEQLADSYQRLELQGIREAGSLRIELEKVFAALKAEPETALDWIEPTQLEALDAENVRRTYLPQREEARRASVTEVKTIADAFRLYHRMVILGGPGSGKTTLGHWLALQMARGMLRQLPREVAPEDEPDLSNAARLHVPANASASLSRSQFAPSDQAEDISAIRIDALPARGTLALSGTPATVGQVIGIEQIERLTYTPAENECGSRYAHLRFTADGRTTSRFSGAIGMDVGTHVRVPVSQVDLDRADWAGAEEFVDLGPARVPILLRLAHFGRELADRERRQKPALSLEEYFGCDPDSCGRVDGCTAEGRNALLRRSLEDGQAIVILDGLDELEEANRHAVGWKIQDFIEKFTRPNAADESETPWRAGGNQVIVTSRYEGYRLMAVRSGCVHFGIQALQRPAVEHFARAWSAAVNAELGADVQGRLSAEGLIGEIYDDSRPAIRDLATNPLLITVLATVYWADGRLPGQRAGVYDRVVEDLLRVWLGRPECRAHSLQREELLAALEPLAADVQENRAGNGLIGLDRIRELIEGPLALMRNTTPADRSFRPVLDAFLSTIRRDVGLLAEQSAGNYAFFHRTFQEFLAARYLLSDRERAADNIVERLDDPQWREPLLLALEFAMISPEWGPQTRAQLLEDVLAGDDPDAQIPRSAMLVMSALPDLDNVPRHVVGQVAKQLLRSYAFSQDQSQAEGQREEIRDAFVRLSKGPQADLVSDAISEMLRQPAAHQDYAGVKDAIADLTKAIEDSDLETIKAAREYAGAAQAERQGSADAEGEDLSFKGASGFQVGDHNVQNNYYYGQPASETTKQSPPSGDRSCYRGLASFEGTDHDYFYGRDDAIDKVIDRLAADHSGLLIVSGASGIGKSSLLRAGVLPRLRSAGLPGNTAAKTWPCLVFTPGATPLDELAAQLAVLAGISIEEARRPLAANPQLFGRLARQAVLEEARRHPDRATLDPSARQRLVLVIDQFEHIFSRCRNEDERRAFITALESAATAPEPSVLVVLIVRSDHERRCAEYPQLAAAVRDRFLLGPMTERDLELAITQPAERTGVSVERELVERLLADLRGSSGALPWMSHALLRAWRVRRGEVLTVADYDQAGGIETAAAAQAQSTYDALGGSELDPARQVFLQLTASSGDGSARAVPATWDELYANVDPAKLQPVLDLFADDRIIIVTGDGAEISHPSLLTAWPLLRDNWLAERHRRDHAAQAAMRVAVEIDEQEGELFLIVTGPGGLHAERPVRWVGSPGRRLLVPRDAVDVIPDLASLADEVDQGRAIEERLAQYGRLLFEAAFGQDLWQRLLQAATGRRCLELAIRGVDSADRAAMQALRWEALHDATGPLAVRDREGRPSITIVRVVPDAGQAEDGAISAEFQPIAHLPRILFAVDCGRNDPEVQADAEITGILRQLHQNGLSAYARVLEPPTLSAIRRELSAFKPDIFHLISHGSQSPDGQVRIQLGEDHSAAARDEWATAEQLLDAFREAGHAPRIVILSACQTASAPRPQSASSAQGHVDTLPLALRIVAAGVPVVIAMSGIIGAPECRAFTAALIGSVFQGVPLAEAMAMGRQAAYRDAEFSATHWALPTAFLAEHVRSDVPLVDTEVLNAVRERIDALALDQDPALFVRSEFAAAMDRLLDGGDPLNVLVACTQDPDLKADDMRLLRDLGAHAVRVGVLPVVVPPFDGTPPTTLDQLVPAASAAIGRVRASLGLAASSRELDRLARGYEPTDVSRAIRADLDHLVGDLLETDLTRARGDGQPKVVLLCHGIDKWQDSPATLLEMLDPAGLRAGSPISVVLAGANAGAFKDLPGHWHGQPWLTIVPLDRAGGAELVEEADEIRTLVAAGNYRQAEERLARLAAEDPQQAGPLRLELGFLTFPNPDRQLVATAWSAIAAGRTVQSALAADDDQSQLAADDEAFPLGSWPDTAEAAAAAEAAEAVPIQPPASTSTAPRRSPQESGAALEQATVDLFARFFAVDPDAIPARLRRQGAGAQFGHDIELECTVAGSPAVRCHVECKNLDRRVTVDDIAGKLAQQKYYHHGTQIDHWILISPHHDVANDLSGMLDAWDRQGEYPFSVQIWSPETRVREIFALEPAVYEAVYGRPPTREEVSASTAAAELIRQRLTPRLRVDAVWRRYLEQPGTFCFVNEDSRHFDGLYRLHLSLKAADEGGRLLDGTLMEQVLGWASDGGTAPMLVLADFGEGKSVFTYCLTRQLAKEFRAAPDGALFPLRIPLRDFHKAGSAQELLKRRLDEIDATLGQWRALTRQVRTLAILDGFDEMSTHLSPAAITANLRDIRACIDQFSGSKVLVTSRQRVLDGSRDWKRTLDRLGKPQVMRIASGSRRQRVEYLEHFATDEASARVLANLRGLYDPIGLAAKPLFLEMIKDTLRDLPDDTFSETILYDTYIDKSLRRKAEFLLDPDELLIADELVENLKDLLEDIAVRLQEANASYVYLRDYQGRGGEKLAELLWRMRDQPAPRGVFALAAQDDAASRVGIRSLLKAVLKEDADSDRWPVDFFHRSMREYFVARSIVHSLIPHTERVRQLLAPTPLLPEIAHFAATILRSRPDDAALAALERLARSDAEPDGYLGGNALTLLHGAGGILRRRDWSGLRLNHARLRGADLRGTRFAGSSLRHSNLDNANLEDADLTDADLEGVRLEETLQVLAVTTLDGNRIIAAYEDRSLRQWRGRPSADWESEVIATLQHKTERLQVTPLGRVMAFGEGMLSVLDMARGAGPDDSDEPNGTASPRGAGAATGAPGIRCAFRMSSRCRAAVLGTRTALFTEEGDGGRIGVTLLDVTSARVLNALDFGDGVVTASAQVDGELFALATSEAINVFWPDEDGQYKGTVVVNPAVTCLAVRADDDGVLLAAGHQDGSVSLTRLHTDIGVTDPPWLRKLHDGPVTGILLDAEDQVVTGSTDRSVCVLPASALRPGSELPDSSVQRLHLTLRCKGVRYEGVRTEREQEKLRQYAES